MSGSFKQRVGSVKEPEITNSEEEDEEEEIEDMVYVAVGLGKESETTFKYAFQYSKRKKLKLCLLHVHERAKFIPNGFGAKVAPSQMREDQVKAYHELQRQKMEKSLQDNYLKPCRRNGVEASKLHIEAENIEKGIVELISHHKIRNLIMGSALANHGRQSERISELKSKKAEHVRKEAPGFCEIQFVYKGNLVFTREIIVSSKSSGGSGRETPSQNTTSTDQSQVTLAQWRSVSTQETRSATPISPTSSPKLPKSRSEHVLDHDHRDDHNKAGTNNWWAMFKSSPTSIREAGSSSITSSHSPPPSDHLHNNNNNIATVTSPISSFRMDHQAAGTINYNSNNIINNNYDDFWDILSSRRSPSELSVHSYGTTSPIGDHDPHKSDDPDQFNPSPTPSVLDTISAEDRDDCLFYEQLRLEADNAKRDALSEGLKRSKAEKEAFDALRRAKVAENQRDEVVEELQNARTENSYLESQIEEYNQTVKELERKMISVVDMLRKCEKDREEFKTQRDNAIKRAEDLTSQMQLREGSTRSKSILPHDEFVPEFSFAEVKEATRNFDSSMKIGEGGYGSIYRGLLRHTKVAIKTLKRDSSQGFSEFSQEANVLSKMRHPNIVTLIGTCPKESILIYEYLANGSLEDRLNCKNGTPPLPWETRINIAVELCSVLIFLHSGKPYIVVHGDLKPANLLLTDHYTCKLGDFGICRIIPHVHDNNNPTGTNSEQMTLFHLTQAAKGTQGYMDPEYFNTGELTTMSDVYSFGVILLKLLTGKPAKGLIQLVQDSLDKRKLKEQLDGSAGEWPLEQAVDLAQLALRCCDRDRKKRPDLGRHFWREFAPILKVIQRKRTTYGRPFNVPIS